ncbi:MAG: 2-dehydro-3,6-dideoxy-6-sulfogluconate aldolase [Nitrosomonadaceae bacterium]|nr:2-dehydro-3,6-dideoxy-6-sulfogluconate aldolase [Nitrosomonadaceae bacterium]
MSKMFQKIAANELALGLFIKGGPHIVSTLAKGGYDFVRPDMMFSGIDWRELEHVVRASEACGITTMPRIATNPWMGGEDNLQCTVDAARAFSLGAEAVQVSVASAKQVEALVGVAKDWHRSGAGYFPTSKDEFSQHMKTVAEGALLVPAIESSTAMRDIEAILEIDGLRAIFVAITDLADQLGHRLDYEHPEVWAAFDKIVNLARPKGIIVFVNTGYLYRTKETIAQRVSDLHRRGAQVVLMQGVEFLLEVLSVDLLEGIREKIR